MSSDIFLFHKYKRKEGKSCNSSEGRSALKFPSSFCQLTQSAVRSPQLLWSDVTPPQPGEHVVRSAGVELWSRLWSGKAACLRLELASSALEPPLHLRCVVQSKLL